LIVNSDYGLPSGYTLSLATMNYVRSEGGSIDPTDATLTMPENIIGKMFRFSGTSYTLNIANNRFNSSNFYFTTDLDLNEFIHSATTAGVEATFNGERLSLDITPTMDISINNLVHDGTLTSSGVVIVNTCKMLSNVVMTAGQLLAIDSTLTFSNVSRPILAGLKLENSTLSEPVETSGYLIANDSSIFTDLVGGTDFMPCDGLVNIDGCDIGPANFTIVMGGAVNLNFRCVNSTLYGSYITPTGTGDCIQFIIENNKFVNVSGFAEYVPITDTCTLNVTGSALDQGFGVSGLDIVWVQPAYGPIHIANNSPTYPRYTEEYIDASIDSAPIKIKQTHYDLRFEISGSSSGVTGSWLTIEGACNLNHVNFKSAWIPTNNKDFLSPFIMDATSGNTIGYVDITDPTPVSYVDSLITNESLAIFASDTSRSSAGSEPFTHVDINLDLYNH
jgi:hypothetical protein